MAIAARPGPTPPPCWPSRTIWRGVRERSRRRPDVPGRLGVVGGADPAAADESGLRNEGLNDHAERSAANGQRAPELVNAGLHALDADAVDHCRLHGLA